ncbi:MAG: hypothetical protein Kow00105_18100 [Phycisphaeraceae bacterium]
MATLGTRRLVEVPLDASRAERLEAARKSYEQDRSQMTSVLARQYNLSEAEVIGILPQEQVTPLDVSQWETIIRSFEEVGNVHVIMSNSSGVLEVFGRFGNFSKTGPFFNVQTKTIDMHLRPDTLAHIFAIEKPSHMDRVPTLSIQFFNHEGHAAFKVFFTFGGKTPDPERRALWEAIRDRCRQA